jgi:nucleotide-binding universal stress UspA family protein
MVVHYCARPVPVIPHPMLAADYDALPDGPVVVGRDGSAGAETALAAARRLFAERDALLVSVGEGATAEPPAEGSAAREVVLLTVDRGAGFHGRAISDALVACARDRNAAVVIGGSRGRSAANEILLGSVAMGTLHHSHRPVMVVPSDWQLSSEPDCAVPAPAVN